MSLKSSITQLIQHQGFRKYFANTSWLFAEKVLRLVVGFFVGVWVARYLGPEQYGLLSYAQAIVGFLSIIASLGLNSIIVRELVRNKSKEGEILQTALGLKTISASLTFLLLFFILAKTDLLTSEYLIFILSLSLFFQVFTIYDAFFQARVLSKYIFITNVLALIFTSLLKVYFILINASLYFFAIAIVTENFLLSASYIFWYLKLTGSLSIQTTFNLDLAKKLLKDSLPLVFATMTYFIYYRIDQIMIKEMLDAKSVGYYAVAVKINELYLFIPSLISTSVFPAILNAKEINTSLYYSRLQKLYTFTVWLTILAIFFFFYYGDFLITNLYGENFQNAVPILHILLISNLFTAFAIVRHKWLIAENLQKYTIYMHVVGALSNIILNLFLINFLELQGAAIASVISYFVALIIIPSIIPKLRISLTMYLKALLLKY